LKKWLDKRTVEICYDNWLENRNKTGDKILIDSFVRGDTVKIKDITYFVTERKTPPLIWLLYNMSI
jgi:hypothetical protein